MMPQIVDAAMIFSKKADGTYSYKNGKLEVTLAEVWLVKVRINGTTTRDALSGPTDTIQEVLRQTCIDFGDLKNKVKEFGKFMRLVKKDEIEFVEPTPAGPMLLLPPEVCKVHIKDLHLPTRPHNALIANEVLFIEDIPRGEKTLLKMRGMGTGSAAAILKALEIWEQK